MASSIKKKFNAAKRFGARYGRKLRHKFVAMENLKKQDHRCPSCSYIKVFRFAAGIWGCKKCNLKFAARAYTPQIKSRTQQAEHKQFGLSEKHLEQAELEVARIEKESLEREKARQAEKEAKLEQEAQAQELQQAEQTESQEESTQELNQDQEAPIEQQE